MNSQTHQLLKLIDRERPQKPNIKTIYDGPAVLASSIKSMYNAYKKSKQFQILQNKVYTISINEDEIRTQTYKKQKITAKILCEEHKLSGDDIENLIMIKHFLQAQTQQQLLQEILTQCNSLKELNETLKSYKKILKDTEYIHDIQKYRYVENQMIEKVLSFELRGEDFRQIASFIITLPHLGQSIMKMMGSLFEKTQQLSDFEQLNTIYKRLSQRINNTQVLLKISTPQNIHIIQNTLQSAHQTQRNKLIQLAKGQAEYKIKNLDFSVLSDKTKCLIDFIFLVVKYESSLWTHIIEWSKILNNQCKLYIEKHIDQAIHTIFSQTQTGKKIKMIYHLCEKSIEIGQENIVSNKLMFEFLKRKNENYLVYRKIRKFMAWKTVSASFTFSQFWRTIFDLSTYYVDVVIEMFAFQQCLPFFKMFLETYESNEIFMAYLKELLNTKPNLFIELFLKIDKNYSGQILQYNKFAIIQYLANISDYNIAFTIIREMTDYTPSKFCVSILFTFLKAFQSRAQANVIITQIIRTLNIILINRKPSQLFSQFKMHLRQIAQSLVGIDRKNSELLFRNVPKEMIEELKKYDDQSKRM